MAQDVYYINDIKYYKISVSRRGKSGKRIRRRATKDHHGKLITSKNTANRIEYRLKKEVDEEYHKSSILIWKEWHKQCLKNMRLQLMESTVIDYEKGLTKWLPSSWQMKDLSKFTKQDIFELIFNEIGSRDNSTKNIQRKVLQKVKRIFEMAVEENIIDRNPAVGVSVKVPPRKQKAFNTNEANTLLNTAKECRHRYYYHWALALFTGMRNGELYALRWKDIDLQSELISVTKQWTSKDGLHATKSNQNRVVPISKELKKILNELKNIGPFEERLYPGHKIIKELPKGDPRRQGPMFNDLALPRYSDWRHGVQAKILRAFCQKLGIEEIKFHDLRATLITNMLSQGVPLAKVMAIVGHSDISVTNEYLRLAGVDIKKGTTDMLGYFIKDNDKKNIIKLYKTA